MATFVAIKNKKQTAGAMAGVLKYVGLDCKTKQGELRFFTGQKKERMKPGEYQGWLGEVAYNAVEFGRYLEQSMDMPEPPPIPTWSESKQRS